MAKKDRVVEAFLHRGVIDQRTYERQLNRLDEEIVLAETALHDARLDELDVQGVLAFAEHVLTKPGRLWMEASFGQKQRLQKVLFPQGVTYSADGRFGIAEISMIFRLLQALPAQKANEASPTGFELDPTAREASDEKPEMAGSSSKVRASRGRRRNPATSRK